MQVQVDSEEVNDEDEEQEHKTAAAGDDRSLQKEEEEARCLRSNFRPRGAREQGGVPQVSHGEEEKARVLFITHRGQRITGSEEEKTNEKGGDRCREKESRHQEQQ